MTQCVTSLYELNVLVVFDKLYCTLHERIKNSFQRGGGVKDEFQKNFSLNFPGEGLGVRTPLQSFTACTI